MPKRASGVAMRMSAPALMARPPPTATPSICAITGFFTRATRPERRSTPSSYLMPSSAPLNCWNWLMSVPATNALPPAPFSTSTRIESSASTSSHTS